MSKIRLLSDHLANQIAAGEVVERPASVVKELLENSLDAGATRVSVQVEGSGTRLVRVVDNGEGMDGDDVLLSIERHATSKLFENSRLDAIATLGFRGEALPSIGSVSRLILLSRPADRETGTRAEMRYGRLHGVHEAGCAQGTIVEVRNLFGNVPARKKFLKTARTELFHIEEAIRNQSLAHVHTAFSLEVEGRSVLDLPARKTLKERFCDTFRCRDYWLQVESGDPGEDGTRLHGFLQQPEPSAARGNRLRILVNGRPVQDRMIRHAVVEGLHSFLMKGQAPGGVLLLEIPPDQVDVNVHPAKQEIRFRHSQEVHRFIAGAVNESVRRYQDSVRSDVFAVPDRSTGPETIRQPVRPPAPRSEKSAGPSLFSPSRSASSWEEVSCRGMQTAERIPAVGSDQPGHSPRPLPADPDEPAEDLTGLTLVGQLFNLYLLCEKGDQLVVVDQHAAHERVIYEELRRDYRQRNIPRQHLMFPVSVELSSGQAAIAESRSNDLALLGFQVEHFGDATWVVKSVPALVSHVDTAELLHETLEGLRSAPAGDARGVIAGGIDSLLASMACKAAVKAGNRLAPEEILQLLAGMRGTGFFSHCPHGRPVIKTFARREIEQWFKRG
ncbi:MAG: DNA mismatch repair endonuclease MutL [Desulfobulbaceae bacterium]|nr:DNA mismatch repair endonuclease MutL [Desulfobulbaceae bacterium]